MFIRDSGSIQLMNIKVHELANLDFKQIINFRDIQFFNTRLMYEHYIQHYLYF